MGRCWLVGLGWTAVSTVLGLFCFSRRELPVKEGAALMQTLFHPTPEGALSVSPPQPGKGG